MRLIIALFLWIPLQAVPLKVISDGKTIARFDVEIARTEFQLSRGLQERAHLPVDNGMLFIFDVPQDVTMWMYKTPLSLDMLFLNPQGQILHIAHNTEPYSTDFIGPIAQTKYVLEINGGQASKLGIAEGHTLTLPQQ